MRMLLASPIGATRRVLENWMVPLGHKVLTAENYDSATRQLLANPALEMVITEWLLGGNTAYDLLMKAKQVTRVSDVAEVTSGVRFVVMVTPGWENARLHHQMDALKALDQVALVDKPINRDTILRAISKCSPSQSMTATPAATPAAVPSEISVASPVGTPIRGELPLQPAFAETKKALSSLVQLHAEAQQHLSHLSSLLE